MISQLYSLKASAYHFAVDIQNCPADNPGCSGSTNLPEVALNQATVRTGLQIVFGVVGALALIYIVLAAFQLVASQGDPQNLAKARQSVIFALIGLVIALSAEVLVSFVIMRS